MNVPCCQLNASWTKGTTEARRPPKKIAEIGTPSGFSQAGSITGHCPAGAVKRALGWAAGLSLAGVHFSPSQLVNSAGFLSVMLSHQMSPSGVSAQLVKIEFLAQESIAFLFDFIEVPGATPKKPYSGLIA